MVLSFKSSTYHKGVWVLILLCQGKAKYMSELQKNAASENKSKGKILISDLKRSQISSSQLMAIKNKPTKYTLIPEKAKTHLFQHINCTLFRTPAMILTVL